MGAIANSILVLALLVLVITITAGLAGVGEGVYHSGTIEEKLVVNGDPHILVDEGLNTRTLTEVQTLDEWVSMEVGDEIAWEDRGMIHVLQGIIASVFGFVAVVAFFIATDDWGWTF